MRTAVWKTMKNGELRDIWSPSKIQGTWNVARMAETKNVYGIWWWNFLESVHLEDQVEDGRITLIWMLRMQNLRMRGKWNWLKTVFSDGLWYYWCKTFQRCYRKYIVV